jgi:hypothetical protein
MIDGEANREKDGVIELANQIAREAGLRRTLEALA